MLNEFTKHQFLEVAKSVSGHFDVDQENKIILNLLHDYVNKNTERFEQFDNFNINKGFFLYSPPGVGKTDLFSILAKILNARQDYRKFATAVAWKIANQYAEDGFDVFNKYLKNNWCFDELGLIQRETAQHYGNKTNVSELLIMERYNAFRSKGLITHFTSNHSLESLQKIYDARVISRLQEMCNFYYVGNTDRRKSKKPQGPPIEAKVELTIEQKQQMMISNLHETLLTPYDEFLKNPKKPINDEFNISYRVLKNMGIIVEGEDYENLLQNVKEHLKKLKPLNTREALELKEFIANDANTNNTIFQTAIARAKNEYFQAVMSDFRDKKTNLKNFILKAINSKNIV